MATITGGLSLEAFINYGIGSELRTGSVRGQIKLGPLAFSNGTSSGKIDRAWDDQRSLADTANENLDLAGSLADLEGTTVTFAKIKMLAIRNNNTTQSNILKLKPHATAGLSGIFGAAAHTIWINGGGVFLWYDPTGLTVTATTADSINLEAIGGATISYDILIAGTSS